MKKDEKNYQSKVFVLLVLSVLYEYIKYAAYC